MAKKIILILLMLLLLAGDVLLVIDIFKGASLFISITSIIITLPLIVYFSSFALKQR